MAGLLDIRRWAPWLLTVVLVIAAQALVAVKWWRPACDMVADGGGFYGRGFPFPAAMPTVMSLEFVYMPHVQLLNLVVLAAVIHPPASAAHRWLTGRLPSLRWPIAWIALSSALMAGGLTTLMTVELGRPTLSIVDQGYEHYWDFRPAALVVGRGARPCVR